MKALSPDAFCELRSLVFCVLQKTALHREAYKRRVRDAGALRKLHQCWIIFKWLFPSLHELKLDEDYWLQ